MTEPRLTDALADLVAGLLKGLEGLRHAGRNLHPSHVHRLGAELGGLATGLGDAITQIEPLEWPEDRRREGADLLEASRITHRALVDFVQHSGDGRQIFELYRALRSRIPAYELLFPLCAELPPVSMLFTEPAARKSKRLAAWMLDASRHEMGIEHHQNDRRQRGGFSLYSPFAAVGDESTAQMRPLVVALHGGSGHGREFLWSWIQAARTRGAIVAAPTSLGSTWSLMEPGVDRANLDAVVQVLCEHLPIDPRRILLTGMSDGGTFALLAGLQESSPFTHLAPMCGVLAPLDDAQRAAVAGRKIFWVHGALDWMFPPEVAQMATTDLANLGADVSYLEIEDLSHTYPSETNGTVLEWFDPSLALPPDMQSAGSD